MLKIKSVDKNSVGYEIGLKKGDSIISFDGYKAIDELDYLFYDSKENFRLEILKKNNKTVIFDIDKYEDEALGVSFELAEENIKTCHNNCIFCFVEQMPKGMRQSLYIKDDDFKMSFMCGNFVTLTNLCDEDIDRIIRLHLSPLYVSVHSMDGEIRKKMMNNRFADKISGYIKRLIEGGIELNTQIVLVNGVNDGENLLNTAKQLYSYYPSVKTMAVVPVGTTKFRDGLYKVKQMDKPYCQNIVKMAEKFNKDNDCNFFMPSDEFYFKAEMPLPPYEFYGNFDQIENGVGMTAKFIYEFNKSLKKSEIKSDNKRYLITGTSSYNFIKNKIIEAEKYIKNLNIEVVRCKNYFFGETVTCTGLLTGSDILAAIKPISENYNELILPSCTLKEFEQVFLDGMTVAELEEKSGKKITISHTDGESFFKTLAQTGV